MAEFHLHGQIISRTDGRSAVAAAAYRAGQALHDMRLDQTFDYTRKHEVDESVILAPEHAPEWLIDREALWNTVEAAERRKNSQVAREFDIGMPRELVAKNPVAAKQLVQDWARDMFVDQALMADISFHNLKGHNPHAHLMVSMRRVHPFAMEFEEGSRFAFEETKARDLNDWGYMDYWRETWADYANAAMAEHGIDARIDHRSLIDQGISDREPGIHVGPRANAMQERGVEADRWEQNAWIWFSNEEPWFEQNRQYVAFLDAEEAEERRREQERLEAERAEHAAATTMLRQAGRLLELGPRLDDAIDRKLRTSRSASGELGARMDAQRKDALTAASARLDLAAYGLKSVERDLLGRLGSAQDHLRTLGGRLDQSVQVVLAQSATRYVSRAKALDLAVGGGLHSKVLRLEQLDERQRKQGGEVLSALSASLAPAVDRLASLKPDLATLEAQLADNAARLRRAVERVVQGEQARLAGAAARLQEHRPSSIEQAVSVGKNLGALAEAVWVATEPVRTASKNLLAGIGHRVGDVVASLSARSEGRRIGGSQAVEEGGRTPAAAPPAPGAAASAHERRHDAEAGDDYLVVKLLYHLQGLPSSPMRRRRDGWVLEPSGFTNPYYAKLALKVGDHERIRAELRTWGRNVEDRLVACLAGPEPIVRMSDDGLVTIAGKLPEELERLAPGMLEYDPRVQAAAELATQGWSSTALPVQSPAHLEPSAGTRCGDDEAQRESERQVGEQDQATSTWYDQMIADPDRWRGDPHGRH